MAKAQLYSILGGDEAHAANIWPRSRIKSTPGFSTNDDPLPLLKYLQRVLEFDAVRPGASPDPVDHATRPGIPPGQVGLIANLVVKSDPTALPLVITQMPDVAFYLVKTLPALPGLPARLYVTHTDKGTEILIEDLPVEIQVPTSLIGTWIVPMAPTSNPFRTGNATRDSLYVQLEDNKPTSIFVYVRVRMTEEMDFVIEPAVPISIGPCRFLGLPCLGLHDINFVPSPNLQGDHTIREQALDWTRHPIDRLQVDARYGGQLTVRTVDIDSTNTPLKDILQRMASPVLSETAEFVLEDVALPFWSIATLPLPSHGLFGLRRGIKAGDDLKEAFGISGSPLNIKYLLGSDFTLLVDQLLLQTPAKEDADQFIFVQTEVYKSDTPPDKAMPMTIGIAADWTVQLGQHRPTGSLVFTLFGATLKLYGFKLGFAIKRALAHTSFGDMIQVLLDLGLSTKDSPLVDSKFFQIRSLSGKDLDVVLNDVGWNLGQFSLEGLSFPEGVQIIAFDIARLIVDDMGWVTENNGGRYFSFSGGISLFGLGQPTPSKPGTGLQDNDRGFGFRFHRLRGRVGGNSHAPAILLDGITLSLEVGRFSIRGTGLYSEFTLEGTEYKEFGLALLASFDLFLYRVALGLALFYGRATGNQSFTYWMFAFQFSPIPLYIVELTNVRMLLAGNVVPDLDNFQDEGYAQNMRLFRWYQAHQSAITLPDNRKLASWKRQEHTFAMGIGASFTVPVGNFMVTFDLFGFYEYTRESVELMIALEAFLAEGSDPIGYGAIEIDLDQGKFGFMLGVTLTLAQVLKIHLPDFLTNMFALTGSLYVGNKPSTFAIGQLNDQSTWLTYRFDKRVPFLGGGKLEVALCLQTVDAPGGPSGFGFLFDAAGSQPFGFGLVEFYASMAMMAGIWRNESTVSGFLMQIEAGLRIKVFWVFNFGISVKIDFHYLGPAPTYRTLDVQFRIETPWWLPDVTVHFSKSWDSQQPSQMKAISPPLQPGGSLRPGLPPPLKLQSAPAPAAVPSSDTHPDVLITSLPNQETDQHALYHMDELRALKELSLPDSDLDKLLPVSVDSVIALNFKPGVDDQTTTGENTPVGASKQQSNDLSVNYELVALGIRRRPRFGTNAGTWTTLLAPEDTRYKSPADFPPGSDIEAHYTSAISYMWDRDMVSSGQLDPRRLLINADTPYSFLTKNPEGDESTARNEPQWPCASGGNIPIPWHELNFLSLPLGVQPPAYQTFSNSRSTLHFVGSVPVVVAPSSQLSNTPHVARLIFAGRSDGTFALVNFDQPAASFEASLYWSQHAWSVGGFLAIETYNGLKLVQQHILDLSLTNHLNVFSQGGQQGLTSVVFRYSAGTMFRTTPNTAWIEILDMGYYDLKDSIDQFNKSQKANARSKRILSGSGKLAWLPNHDYEISLATRVTLAHESSGQQQTEVMQKAYFRTKGLPGLNAVDRLGDEIEPFLESHYPDTLPATRLYRSEVALLAFNEKFNTLWPLDRAPAPNDPGELQQILAWVLAIDKPGSPTSGAERISQTGSDWVVFHRRDPFPLLVNPRAAKLCNDVVSSGKRIASTLDPMMQRFERMLQRPQACQDAPQAHASRLVIHQPVNLGGGTLWEPNTLYRANLRVKDAPSVERDPFEAPDASAFDISKDGSGSDCSWSSLDGTLRASQTSLIGDAGTHHYAIFGENNWNHVQVHCTLDPHGYIAGIAIGVERQGAFVQRSVLVLIDEHSGGKLRLVELRDGNERELDSKPLLTQASAPYALEVMAFDDQVRARVGDVVVQAPRDDVRDGRLALVTQRGNATFTRLLVESLDAYRFQFMTSRFASFVDHIQSVDSTMTVIANNPFGPGSTLASVDALFSSSATQIAAAMKPGADPEQRQRLFDQWVGALALPLRRRLTGLHMSSIKSGSNIDLLLLEGPEPLPFSKNVTLKIFQRSISSPHPISHPLPGGHMPSQALSNWVASLTFSNDNVSGPIPVHLVPSLSNVSQFVLALPSANGLALYVYDVAMRPGLRGAAELSSTLKQVVYPRLGSLLNPDPLVKKFANVQANQLAVIDKGGNISNFISINPHSMVRFVSVPVSILTNGSETHALIIPVDVSGTKNVQLTSGFYRFDFSIDRVRYRQQVPDNTSNYRAQASFTKSW